MADILISVVLAVGVNGLLVFLLRNWFIERLRQGIKFEYDEKLERIKQQLSAENDVALERHKAVLSREASILAVAHNSLGESLALAQRERAAGVAELWRALVTVRNNAPSIFTLLDALSPAEYSTLQDHQFKTFDPNIGVDDFRKLAGDSERPIEAVRVFVGDYLWFLFYIYKGIHIRIAMLFADGRSKRTFVPWYQDTGTRTLLASALTGEELKAFDFLKFGQIAHMRQVIERKFLDAANRIISGRDVSEVATAEATRLARAVLEVPIETRP